MIGDTVFGALLADTPAKRVQGLSGTPDLPRQTGMLFVFERGGVSAFWMKDMLIPLDFVWIGENCQVIEVTEEVPNPPPGTPDSSLRIYRPSEAAEYALEINAGEVSAHGIRPGDDVRFENMNSPNAHC